MDNPITAVHPGVLEEIPGVELEADREDINTSAIEAVSEPSLAARADAVRLNENLTEKKPGVPLRKIAGVNKKNDVIVIVNDSSDLDVDDGYNTDDTEEGTPKMQKAEYDNSDDKDDADDDEDVSPDEDEIEAEAEAPQVQQLG